MGIKVREFLNRIEELYPLELQEEWDCSGLINSPPLEEIALVGVCLSLTSRIIDEAKSKGIGLILCHHPLFNEEPQEGEVGFQTKRNLELLSLLKASGIGAYAVHTNFDKVSMSVILAEKLELIGLEVLDQETGLGVVGRLKTPMLLSAFYEKVKHCFDARRIQVTPRIPEILLSRISVCGGSGKDFLEQGMKKSQIYLTGDLSFHNFELAEFHQFPLVDIGHYSSESLGMSEFALKLNKSYPGKIVYLDSLPSSTWA